MPKNKRDIKVAIQILTDNVLARAWSFGRSIRDAARDDRPWYLSPQSQIIAIGEMLLFLLHHVDRLAFEKHVSETMREIVRNEIICNLIDREIIPYELALKLMEKGATPSLEALGVPRSAAVQSLLSLFLKNAADADADYGSCTELVAANPMNESGLLNKFTNRVRSRCGQDMSIVWLPLMLTAAGDAIVEPESAKRDVEALSMLG